MTHKAKNVALAVIDLTSFKSENGTAKAWILPNGKFVEVPSQHFIWLKQNRDFIKRSFGLDVPTSPSQLDDSKMRRWAVANGFVRVNYRRTDGHLTLELNERFWAPKLKDACRNLIDDNADAVDAITVNIMDDKNNAMPASVAVNVSQLDADKKADKLPDVVGATTRKPTMKNRTATAQQLDNLARQLKRLAEGAAPSSVFKPLLLVAEGADAKPNPTATKLIRIIAREMGLADEEDNWFGKDAAKFVKANKDKFSALRTYAKMIPWLLKSWDALKANDTRYYEFVGEWLDKHIAELSDLVGKGDFVKMSLRQIIDAQQKKAKDKAARSEIIVHRFKDGKTFRRLPHFLSIREEGNEMGNCCGDQKHHYDHFAVEKGWAVDEIGGVYALRGPNNERLATVVRNPDGTILEAVGYQNSNLSREKLDALREAIPQYDGSEFPTKNLAHTVKSPHPDSHR